MRISVFLVIFFSSCSFLMGQESLPPRKNLIFLEGGGPYAAGAGIGYERYLSTSKFTRFSIRGGGGMIEHFTSLSFYGGSSFVYGRKFMAEAGFNYISRIDQSNFRFLDEEEEKVTEGVQFLLGFRYQNPNNGLGIRIFFIAPVGTFKSLIPYIPYPGLSVGYAF